MRGDAEPRGSGAAGGGELELRRAELSDPAARDLIGALNAELGALHPEPGANHFRLDAEEVAPGRGAFLLALRGGAPVGCGAVRRLDRDAAELERMYVVPAERGRGTGRALLDALEAEARELGAARVVLETGVRQRAALELYASAGYARTEAFGEHRTSPLGITMAKRIR